MVQENNTYQSLDDVRRHKMRIKADLAKSEKGIATMWNNLFHAKPAPSVATPSKRMAQIITTGAGVLDGVMLGWKLYRRFKK